MPVIADLSRNVSDDLALSGNIGSGFGSALGYREKTRQEAMRKHRESWMQQQIVAEYQKGGSPNEIADRVLALPNIYETTAGKEYAQNYVAQEANEENQIRAQLFEWTKLRDSLDVDDPAYQQYSDFILEMTKPLVEKLRLMEADNRQQSVLTNTSGNLPFTDSTTALPPGMDMQTVIDSFLNLETKAAKPEASTNVEIVNPDDKKEEKRGMLTRFLESLNNGQSSSSVGYSPFPGTPKISFNQKKPKSNKTDKEVEKTFNQIPDEQTVATTVDRENGAQGGVPHPDLAPYWEGMSDEEKQTVIHYLKSGGDINKVIALARQK